ncbi:MAG: hypothetical protein CMO10_15465 [Thalassospira sp.]|nr:hypothetical protein [Thalassospira sp.]|tara:strand:+ start:197 stop:394 length:198 start_codon:yes stop_codon:yes gene_type:complete
MIRAVFKVRDWVSIFALWQVDFAQTVTDITQFANAALLLSIKGISITQNRHCINALIRVIAGVKE